MERDPIIVEVIFKDIDRVMVEDVIPFLSVEGEPGKSVDMQNTGEKIQWQHEGDEEWTDLIDITDLKGDPGLSPFELAVQEGYGGSVEDFNEALASIGNLNDILDIINGEIV